MPDEVHGLSDDENDDDDVRYKTSHSFKSNKDDLSFFDRGVDDTSRDDHSHLFSMQSTRNTSNNSNEERRGPPPNRQYETEPMPNRRDDRGSPGRGSPSRGNRPEHFQTDQI